MDSKTYILIHGAWMDGTSWAGVASHLHARGYTVHAPTMAGHGPGANRQVSHTEVVQGVLDFIEGENLRDFVLVGHSFGGTVIQKVAEATPDRIRRLVFCNAFVLKDKECLVEHTPAGYPQKSAQLAAASADGTVSLPFGMFRDGFVNDGDLATAQRIHASLHPCYFGLFEEKIALPAFDTLPIPRSYLYCTEDHGLPHGETTGWYPKFGNRLGLFRLVTMPGSHMAHLTRSEDMAAKLIEAGRD